jgi:hypothetical protein
MTNMWPRQVHSCSPTHHPQAYAAHLALGGGQQCEVPLVQAALACILPHHGIDGSVGVHQGVMEPAGALLPRQVEVLCEEGGRHHAHALLHPARLPQFPHACSQQHSAQRQMCQVYVTIELRRRRADMLRAHWNS